MKQKVALITGATGAIGQAIACAIAKDQEYRVVLACRNESKARIAVNTIKKLSNNPNISYELVDVSREQSIVSLVNRWQGPLHVLVNNAAIAPRERQETPEGVEMQFATNVMGYFWMMMAFSKTLRNSAPSRVVNVASYWSGGLNVDDLEFKQRHYHNDAAYRQSKQANRMLTVAFADRFRSFGVSVNACHPGDVNSTLSRDLGFGGHESPAQGAVTPVWLATDAIGQNKNGYYFEGQQAATCQFSRDKNVVNQFYDVCKNYTNQLSFC